MKKAIATLVLIFTVSFSFAQKKTVEQVARANTKEMVEVLSLDKAQEKAVYNINLEKNKKLEANIAKDQSEEDLKINRRAIYKMSQQAFRESLGKVKAKEWNIFKKAKNKDK